MKNYCDTMMMVLLPLSHHPDAKMDDIIKLTTEDIEYINTNKLDGDFIEHENQFLSVRYATDGVILGNILYEVNLDIKTGFVDPGDYKVVGER